MYAIRSYYAPESLLSIIKWSHIYDRIEEAVARVEALADILEGVMLKNA